LGRGPAKPAPQRPGRDRDGDRDRGDDRER
jgi:hypothetical protein